MGRWPRWGRRGRTTGRPTSSNGASSMHLRWNGVADDGRAVVGASVTLEVLEPPRVPELYFWALQVDLAGPSGPAGGAHLGLQWYPRHPGSTAVNWGGYRHGGGELDGTASALPSATGNPNTRDFVWQPGRRYRLAVARVGGGPVIDTAWRGEVTDVDSGVPVVVRDLCAPADRLAGVVMWSEVFARCDDPTVAVRWSSPEVTLADGTVRTSTSMSVNYQSAALGGCSNTDSSVHAGGYLQRTATSRTTPQGGVLRVTER
jgi:hypothetical protein